MELFLNHIGYLIAILLGFIGRRAKVFTKDSLVGLRFVVIYILFPISFYKSFQQASTEYVLYGFLYTIGLIILSIFLLWILQFNKNEIEKYLPALFLTNSSLLGVFFLDPHLGLGTRYSLILFAFSNLAFIYLFLIYKKRHSSKKIFFHLAMIIFLGGFFFIGPKLPGMIQRVLEKIAGERGSFFYLLYLMIGIKLPEIELKEMIQWDEFLVISLCLLIIPVFTTMITRFLPINVFAKNFMIISSLMPASPMVILFEQIRETHLLKVFIWTQILGIISVSYLLPLLT